MAVSAALFAWSDATAKQLAGGGIHVFEIAFMRYALCLSFLGPYALAFRYTRLKTRHPLAHVSRALLLSLAQVLSYFALSRMFVADVTAINFARPLCITVLAVLFLGERVDWRRWAATAAGFAGVIVMVRPGAAGTDTAAFAALTAMAMFAVASFIIARYADTERPIQFVFYYNATAAALFALPAIWTWRDPAAVELALMLLLAVLGLLADICAVKSLSAGEASVVGPVEYVRLIAAALLGYALFAEVPGPTTWIGAAVIVASALYITRRARLGARRARQGG